MNIIDGIKKLTPEIMKQYVDDFASSHDCDITICMNDELFAEVRNVKNPVNTFFEMNLNDYNDDCIISFKSKSTTLLFAVIDWKWWNVTRRKNKMMKFCAEPTITTVITYTIGCATIVDRRLTHIKTFTGTKADIVEFMNSEIYTRMIETFLEGTVVFNLAYTKESEQDIGEWLTVNELVEIGAVTVG